MPTVQGTPLIKLPGGFQRKDKSKESNSSSNESLSSNKSEGTLRSINSSLSDGDTDSTHSKSDLKKRKSGSPATSLIKSFFGSLRNALKATKEPEKGLEISSPTDVVMHQVVVNGRPITSKHLEKYVNGTVKDVEMAEFFSGNKNSAHHSATEENVASKTSIENNTSTKDSAVDIDVVVQSNSVNISRELLTASASPDALNDENILSSLRTDYIDATRTNTSESTNLALDHSDPISSVDKEPHKDTKRNSTIHGIYEDVDGITNQICPDNFLSEQTVPSNSNNEEQIYDEPWDKKPLHYILNTREQVVYHPVFRTDHPAMEKSGKAIPIYAQVNRTHATTQVNSAKGITPSSATAPTITQNNIRGITQTDINGTVPKPTPRKRFLESSNSTQISPNSSSSASPVVKKRNINKERNINKDEQRVVAPSRKGNSVLSSTEKDIGSQAESCSTRSHGDLTEMRKALSREPSPTRSHGDLTEMRKALSREPSPTRSHGDLTEMRKALSREPSPTRSHGDLTEMRKALSREPSPTRSHGDLTEMRKALSREPSPTRSHGDLTEMRKALSREPSPTRSHGDLTEMRKALSREPSPTRSHGDLTEMRKALSREPSPTRSHGDLTEMRKALSREPSPTRSHGDLTEMRKALSREPSPTRSHGDLTEMRKALSREPSPTRSHGDLTEMRKALSREPSPTRSHGDLTEMRKALSREPSPTRSHGDLTEMRKALSREPSPTRSHGDLTEMRKALSREPSPTRSHGDLTEMRKALSREPSPTRSHGDLTEMRKALSREQSPTKISWDSEKFGELLSHPRVIADLRKSKMSSLSDAQNPLAAQRNLRNQDSPRSL
ncbi:hypothetical protein NHE_0053 [Neorickettsia helminthoeca str. Oregon]|uniref:Uncharacterized protein n=1 Tax=Neorickettsia helminthoeca str. Oregon TaxID=1286528 RepID=X5GVH0_9RICK|nr:hypothetical protein [Neorickettsia helminthoeca]AHX11027.1 hypothetical protein NHE_0053 [Neorickettsia helminthoeca str. Oregon]